MTYAQALKVLKMGRPGSLQGNAAHARKRLDTMHWTLPQKYQTACHIIINAAKDK